MQYPKFTKEQIADVAAYHNALTREAFSVERPPLSDKASAAQEIVSSGAFGCNGEAVARLVSAILGELILPPGPQRPILPGSIVRHETSPPNTMFMVAIQHKDGSLRGHYADGRPTNGTIHPKNIIPASDAEILAFFAHRHGGEPLPYDGDDELSFRP